MPLDPARQAADPVAGGRAALRRGRNCWRTMRYVRGVDTWRRRHASRWLVLAMVLVLVPMLMVLVGWVIG